MTSNGPTHTRDGRLGERVIKGHSHFGGNQVRSEAEVKFLSDLEAGW